jgi:hypothetical protein
MNDSDSPFQFYVNVNAHGCHPTTIYTTTVLWVHDFLRAQRLLGRVDCSKIETLQKRSIANSELDFCLRRAAL